ncbi:MAG TPA: rhodanese-like domain-containing protein [Actinomycetota bacterium]|nr:rhodanese-like domain-containing protein [Actinomycetota bacterium]
MHVESFLTRGLGDTSYLLAWGNESLIVDPQRDVRPVLAAARARELRVTRVLETHVHNDYVSGALELRVATGAVIAGPARAGYAFPFEPLAEGDVLSLGSLRIVAAETPGHTPEHLSYLVYEGDPDEPTAVFTGGSLIVGSAGRTDLLGPEATLELTRAQRHSLNRLSALPDQTLVLPTHGAGSFCSSSPPGEERTSTIGRERASNPALADGEMDEGTFVERRLAGLLAYPSYYSHIAPINRAGPRVFGDVPVPRGLAPSQVAERIEAGAWVVDGGERRAFAAGHIPGSIAIELDDSFASYVGWIVPFGAPIVLVLPEDRPEHEAALDAATQLFRIAYEAIDGYLQGGVDAWVEAGRAVRSYPIASMDELATAVKEQRAKVIDVRQQTEWNVGHLEGSTHIFVGDVNARLTEIPRDHELWTVCASGHRAAMAASLLDRAGIPVRLVTPGGVPDVLSRVG